MDMVMAVALLLGLVVGWLVMEILLGRANRE